MGCRGTPSSGFLPTSSLLFRQMEEQAEELAAEVEKLGQGQMQEALWQEQGAKVQEQGVGARRKESKMAGERLMRLLETLDNISLDARSELL